MSNVHQLFQISKTFSALIEFQSNGQEPPKIQSWNPVKRYKEHKALEQWVEDRPPSAGITATQLSRRFPPTKEATKQRTGEVIGSGLGGAAGAFHGWRRPFRFIPGTPKVARAVSATLTGLAGASVGGTFGGLLGSRKRTEKLGEAVRTLEGGFHGGKVVPAKSIKSDIPKARTYGEVVEELKKQDVGFVTRHHLALVTRPIAWGENAAFLPVGEKGAIVTPKKVHPIVFRHEEGHARDYAHYGGAEGFAKAYPHYAKKWRSRETRISSTLLPEHRAWAYAKPKTKQEKDLRDSALYTYRWAMGLSAKLTDLINFQVYIPSEEERKKGAPTRLPFKAGETVEYVEQAHQAQRAGRHVDIRIGDKPRGMYSWATKKELPGPGGKIQLHPQPIHPQSYNVFQGEIPEGQYGAGTVETQHLGKALVTKGGPDQVNVTVSSKRGSHRLAVLNTKMGHLLVREQHPTAPTAQKPDYKSLSPDRVPEALSSMEPGTVVQPKVDGALVYIKGHKGKLEIFSHRKSKTGEPIIHTERFFRGRPYGDLEGKTILGELYGTREGKAIEPQELGGILNAHLHRSLEKQKEQGVELKIMPFDLQDKGTYPERLAKLKSLVQRRLPEDKFTLPEEATTPKDALDLHERIRKGQHPLTQEGIIIHPPEGKMVKVKHTQEANVKIAGVFPGTGKFEGAPGGFYYADDKGKPVGRVGTGFSDESRRNLEQYIGRTARIRHQGKYKSGAYRAPSFIAVDEAR